MAHNIHGNNKSHSSMEIWEEKKATSQIITKLALYEDNHSKADCCIFAYVSTMC